MASDGVMAYGIIAVLIVYYSASFELTYALKASQWKTYTAFFLLAMLTVIVEMLHNLDNTDDKVAQTVMMWGVVGPVYDMIWNDWPGNGSLVLWTSQLVFILATSDIYRWIQIAVMVFTTILLGMAWWQRQSKKKHYTSLSNSIVSSM